MSKWIRCHEKLPEDGQHGLCALHQFDNPGNPRNVVPFTFLDGQFHPFADGDNVENDDYWLDPLYWPTHWQPLPEPPTDD